MKERLCEKDLEKGSDGNRKNRESEGERKKQVRGKK